MKIGVFIESFCIGGVQKVMVTLANEMFSLGHEVFLIVLNDTGPLKESLSKDVQVINLNVPRLRNSFTLMPKVLKENNIDVLLTAKDGANGLFILNKLFYRYKTKIVIAQHNYLIFENKYKHSIYRVITPLMIRYLFNYADGIICVSKGIEKFLSESGVKRTKHTIYNPMDIQRVKDLANEDAPLSDKYILFCGRFSTIKNVDYLIKGFEIVLKKRPEMKLVLVGDGPQRDAIDSLAKQLTIKESVIFTGSQENPYKYMKNSALVALVSLSEAFPMVCLEALALGKTIVSTPAAGPCEILDNNRGYICNSFDDPQILADSIEKALDNPLPSADLVSYTDSFDKTEVAKKYIELFRSVTSE